MDLFLQSCEENFKETDISEHNIYIPPQIPVTRHHSPKLGNSMTSLHKIIPKSATQTSSSRTPRKTSLNEHRPLLLNATKNKQNNKPVDRKPYVPSPRLYNPHPKPITKTAVPSIQKERMQNCTFQPNLSKHRKMKSQKSLTRSQDITQELYNDALRRKHMLQNTQVPQPKLSSTKLTESQNKSTKMVAEKFIKEFREVVESYRKDRNQDRNTKQKYHKDLVLLTIQDLHFILRTLGFVAVEKLTLPCHENELVFEIYQILGGTKEEGVATGHLAVLLLAVQGVFHVEYTVGDDNCEQRFMASRSHGTHTESKFGVILDQKGGLEIDSELGVQLKKHLNVLYRNRMSREQELRRRRRQQRNTKDKAFQDFRPRISEHSRQLAKQFRKRILGETQQNGQVKDILSYMEAAEQYYKSRSKSNKNDKPTFQPTIHKKTSSAVIGGPRHPKQGQQKADDKAKNISKQHPDKTKSQKLKEIPKNIIGQRTYKLRKAQPGASGEPPQKHGISPRHGESTVNFKTYETFYSIDQQGDDSKYDKLFKNHGTFRGEEPGDLQEPQADQYTQNTRKPLLILQVNLGGDSENLMLFEEDLENTESLVEQFAEKHNLDVESKYRLYEVLKASLQQAKII